jgi:hypothetical protein
VATYIASGNVALSSERKPGEIKRQIEEALPKTFRLDSELQIRGGRSMMNPEGGRAAAGHDHGATAQAAPQGAHEHGVAEIDLGEAVSAYIALNPVAAGLCGRPEEWPWSSHAPTIGERGRHGWLDVARLLSHFEGLGGDPRRRYAALTEVDGLTAATVSRR